MLIAPYLTPLPSHDMSASSSPSKPAEVYALVPNFAALLDLSSFNQAALRVLYCVRRYISVKKLSQDAAFALHRDETLGVIKRVRKARRGPNAAIPAAQTGPPQPPFAAAVFVAAPLPSAVAVPGLIPLAAAAAELISSAVAAPEHLPSAVAAAEPIPPLASSSSSPPAVAASEFIPSLPSSSSSSLPHIQDEEDRADFDNVHDNFHDDAVLPLPPPLDYDALVRRMEIAETEIPHLRQQMVDLKAQVSALRVELSQLASEVVENRMESKYAGDHDIVVPSSDGKEEKKERSSSSTDKRRESFSGSTSSTSSFHSQPSTAAHVQPLSAEQSSAPALPRDGVDGNGDDGGEIKAMELGDSRNDVAESSSGRSGIEGQLTLRTEEAVLASPRTAKRRRTTEAEGLWVDIFNSPSSLCASRERRRRDSHLP
jgi:hypothetical protein